MTRQSFDDDLNELLGELAESRSVAVPPWEVVADRHGPVVSPRGRQMLVAAVAMVGLVVVAGLVAVSRRSDTVATGPAAPSGQSIESPAILVPGAAGPAVSTSEPRRQQQTTMEPGGAVAGPSGTIYALLLSRATDEDIAGELVDLGGFETTVITDASAPTQIYRTIDLGCTFLSVTTADAPALTAELTTLVEAMTVSGTDITLTLPPEWTSYGVASSNEQYTSTAQVRTGGASLTDVFLRQSLDAPIGIYLHGETAPVLLASDETDQLWHIAGATTPGYNTLVGTRFGTTFALSGEASVDVLRLIVDTFTAADAPDALPPSSNAESEEAMIEYGAPSRLDCPTSPPTLTVNG